MLFGRLFGIWTLSPAPPTGSASPVRRPWRLAGGRLLAALVFLSPSLLPSQSWGTLMRELSIEALAASSDAVLRGRIRSVATIGSRGMPVTQVVLEVLEVLDGDIGPRRLLRLTQPGGEYDGVALDYAGRPEFREGEETVLFVARRAPDHFIVVGLVQGKFDVGPRSQSGATPLLRRLEGAGPPPDLDTLRQRLRRRPRDLSAGR